MTDKGSTGDHIRDAITGIIIALLVCTTISTLGFFMFSAHRDSMHYRAQAVASCAQAANDNEFCKQVLLTWAH